MISPQSTTPAYIDRLQEDLILAESYLEASYSLSPLFQDSTPELATNIADALSACQEALAVLSNLPIYSDKP
jgi:hypothetical protein